MGSRRVFRTTCVRTSVVTTALPPIDRIAADRKGSPEQRTPVVTEAVGPFGGVQAARRPSVPLTVSSLFSLLSA